MSLPIVDDFKYVVVAIDYFSKRSEARPSKDKTAVPVVRFLYDEVICRREFVNNFNCELFRLTGTEQRVTSAYHPQANGLVERRNRTIKKNCHLKALQNNVLQWPYILQGVLFAHRTAQHYNSLLNYCIDARRFLPIDIHSYDNTTNVEFEENNDDDDNISSAFDKESFNKTLNHMINIRDKVEEGTKENMEDAQKRQRYILLQNDTRRIIHLRKAIKCSLET